MSVVVEQLSKLNKLRNVEDWKLKKPCSISGRDISNLSNLPRFARVYEHEHDYKYNKHSYKYTTLRDKDRIDMYKEYSKGNIESISEYIQKVENMESNIGNKYGKEIGKFGSGDNMDNGMVDIKEAAKILRRSTKTLRTYIKQGKLPAIRGNGPTNEKYYFKLEDLEKFKKGYMEATLETVTLEVEKISAGKHNPIVDVAELLPIVDKHFSKVTEIIENRIENLEKKLIVEMQRTEMLEQEKEKLVRANESLKQENEYKQAEFDRFKINMEEMLMQTMNKIEKMEEWQKEKEERSKIKWWKRFFLKRD